MSTDKFQFDTASNSSTLNYLQGMRQAKQAGKGMFSMLGEIAKLRLGQGKLRPDEYFMYGLFDDARFTAQAKRSFLSQDCNLLESPWSKIAKDKPSLTALLSGLGLPVPETQAIVHGERTFAGAIPLRNRADVCRFLRQQAKYPIFGKPFDSVCSMGTAKIIGYDSASDAVAIGNDQLIPVDGFSEMIESLGRDYLFQTLMLPHTSIADLIGESVSSVRMFVISDDEGCFLFRAAWKIPANVNDADNFWRIGNMLAGIDVETGRIERALVRTANGTEPIAQHPLTGASFENMVFPMWSEMREMVMAAAVNLPDCHFQGWDVALTDRGPVLVELEGDGGNPIMEQLCFESGLLTPRYLRVVEQSKAAATQARKRDAAQDQSTFKNSIVSLALPVSLAVPEVGPSVDAPVAADNGSGQVIAPVPQVAVPVDSSVSV